LRHFPEPENSRKRIFFYGCFTPLALGGEILTDQNMSGNYVDPPKQISAVDVEMKMRGSALAEIS